LIGEVQDAVRVFLCGGAGGISDGRCQGDDGRLRLAFSSVEFTHDEAFDLPDLAGSEHRFA
jgi:hypothetical protein